MSMMGKNRSQDRRKDRILRAEQRAVQTGMRHYNMSPADVDFCAKQIRSSRSNFIIRWGLMRIHEVMSPREEVGMTYVAYDRLLGEISFFIPRRNGRAIAREAAKYGKRSSKAPRMLLPPRRAKQLALPETTGGRTVLSEFDKERKGLLSRISFLKTEHQKCLSGDLSSQSNWKEMERMGTRLEELEAELRALDAAKAKKDKEANGTQDLTIDEMRQKIIRQIDYGDDAMKTCKLGDLEDLSIVRAGLVLDLRKLIPNVQGVRCFVTERTALDTTIQAVDQQVIEFQRTRNYKQKGPGLVDDREKSTELRGLLRTLKAMWDIIFEQVPDTQVERPAPTQPAALAESQRRTLVTIRRELAEVNAALKSSTDLFELASLYCVRDALILERQGIAEWVGGRAPTPHAIKMAKQKRIIATRKHITWFMNAFDCSVSPGSDLLISKQKMLEDIVFEYRGLYPEGEEESHAAAEAEPLLGPR